MCVCVFMCVYVYVRTCVSVCVCVRMYMLRMVAEPVNPLRREATYLSDALTGGRFTLCYVSRVSPVALLVYRICIYIYIYLFIYMYVCVYTVYVYVRTCVCVKYIHIRRTRRPGVRYDKEVVIEHINIMCVNRFRRP